MRSHVQEATWFCWGDGAHTPYLIHVADRLAGFAIVGRGSRLTDNPNVHDLSEFFIVRRYRRQGIGTRAAAALFELRRGVWEVRELAANTAAREFWRRAIGAYSGGRFEEFVVDDDRWHGWVQRFVSWVRSSGWVEAVGEFLTTTRSEFG